ncbi:hypothetical protein PMAG_a2419 [Pseudoalteromonas mariniglutinosa NCIMB 1770]|nr:hypothetical protein [Pseudoalteromonas mariniglutinosa NCIMB 1770]
MKDGLFATIGAVSNGILDVLVQADKKHNTQITANLEELVNVVIITPQLNTDLLSLVYF